MTDPDAPRLPEGLHLAHSSYGIPRLVDKSGSVWIVFHPGGEGDPDAWRENLIRTVLRAVVDEPTESDSALDALDAIIEAWDACTGPNASNEDRQHDLSSAVHYGREVLERLLGDPVARDGAWEARGERLSR